MSPLLVLLPLPLLAPLAPPTSAPEVSVAGLRLTKPASSPDLRPFNWHQGTAIAVLVKVGEGAILACDTDESSITKLSDDQGTDLLTQKADDFYGEPGIQPFAQIAKDGTAALVEVFASGLPTRGAKELVVEGRIALLVGTKSTKDTSDPVTLETGAEFTAGPFALKVAQAGDQEFGDWKYALTLEAKQDLSALASLTFLAPDGEPLESELGSTSRFGFGNTVTEQREYRFKSRPTKARIAVEHWTETRNQAVPLAMRVNLGL